MVFAESKEKGLPMTKYRYDHPAILPPTGSNVPRLGNFTSRQPPSQVVQEEELDDETSLSERTQTSVRRQLLSQAAAHRDYALCMPKGQRKEHLYAAGLYKSAADAPTFSQEGKVKAQLTLRKFDAQFGA